MSFFEARDLIKGMNSEFNVDGVKIWWKHEGDSLEKDIKPFRNYGDASLLSLLSKKNQCDVEIYTKGKPSIGELRYMESLREKNKGKQSVEGDEDDGHCSESSDETINGIHFKDNE